MGQQGMQAYKHKPQAAGCRKVILQVVGWPLYTHPHTLVTECASSSTMVYTLKGGLKL